MSPKRILFICDATPFSENSNGVSSFKYAHLKLLSRAFPKAFIHILILNYYNTDELNTSQLARDFPEGNYHIEILNLLEYKTSNIKRQGHLFRLNLHAIRFFHSFINTRTLTLFHKTVNKIDPDLIWTEHAIPNYFAVCSGMKAPVIYVHHDFLWKLQQLKNGVGNKKKQLINKVLRISEISQIRKNNYIVSGSQSEMNEITRLNSRAVTALFPTTYRSIETTEEVPADIRIVHVGNMRATSNKIGLSRFLTVCWPELCELPHPPELWVIGKVDTGHAQEVVKLLEQPNIRVLGHVDDLSTVLRPYDIHIIPYEYDTGTRTRIPLVLNNKQILLSTRNASNGVKGLQDQDNCLLVNSLEEMTEKIKELLTGKVDYQTIAENGKLLFEKSYTVESQHEELVSFLRKIKH